LAPAQASGCIKQSANGLPRGSNHVLSPVTRCLSIDLIIGQAGKNVNPLLANRCQKLMGDSALLCQSGSAGSNYFGGRGLFLPSSPQRVRLRLSTSRPPK